MARPRTLDYERVLKDFAETGNAYDTALRMGIHYNSVYRVLRESRGQCARCAATIEKGKNMCDTCRAWTAHYEADKRRKRKGLGICIRCGLPVADGSIAYCPKHRGEENANKRLRRAKAMAIDPKDVRTRESRLRRQAMYGPNAVKLLDSNKSVCSICGSHCEGRQRHIHHIDRNHANGSEENLLILCASCHHLVHSLGAHRDPRLVLSWYERTYGEIRSLS